jgi:hypothetical protein
MTTTARRTPERERRRKQVQDRKARVDADRLRRDELETEFAIDFDVGCDARDAALRAVAAAELAMGKVVDQLMGGELRVSYARLAKVLDQPVDELRRLRQLASTAAEAAAPEHDRGADRDDGPAPDVSGATENDPARHERASAPVA